MAKFCGNCGAKMEDTAKVCGNCGTPFQDNSTPIKFEDPEKKAESQKKRKKAIRKYAIIAALVLVVIVTISIIVANTGVNGFVKNFMNAYTKYDIEAILDMSSDVYYYSNADYAEDYFEGVIGSHHDFFESEVGHKYSLSYEIIEIYSLSNRNLDEVKDRISAQFPDFILSDIDDFSAATLEIIGRQGGKSCVFVINLIMTKEDGTWKILYIN